MEELQTMGGPESHHDDHDDEKTVEASTDVADDDAPTADDAEETPE